MQVVLAQDCQIFCPSGMVLADHGLLLLDTKPKRPSPILWLTWLHRDDGRECHVNDPNPPGVVFFVVSPPERGCRQHQRTQTLDSRTERLNSETDSEIHSTPTVVHEAKRLQTSKLWRSFWTGVKSPLGYPSDVPFRIRTYNSAGYKPLVSFVIRTTCLEGSWDRWIMLLHGGNWAHIL